MRLFFLPLSLFLLVSCAASSPQGVIPAGAILVTVVDFRELDGCEFLLQMEDGQKLQPMNLKDEFKVANTRLYITYKYYEGVGICMSGRQVSLIDVVPAKPKKN